MIILSLGIGKAFLSGIFVALETLFVTQFWLASNSGLLRARLHLSWRRHDRCTAHSSPNAPPPHRAPAVPFSIFLRRASRHRHRHAAARAITHPRDRPCDCPCKPHASDRPRAQPPTDFSNLKIMRMANGASAARLSWYHGHVPRIHRPKTHNMHEEQASWRTMRILSPSTT